MAFHFISLLLSKAWGKKRMLLSDRNMERCICGSAGCDLAFWCQILICIFIPCIVPLGEQGEELHTKGDFSLRKLGLTKQGIGCYYQTLMAPDKV